MPCTDARKVGCLARQINASIKSGEYKPSLTLQNHAPEDVVAKGLLSSLEKLLGEKNAMGGSSSDSSKTVNKNTSQQPVKVVLGMEVVGEDVRSHLSAWIRAPPTISEETASRLHLVERGKKNVRVSRASCVEWSDARESVFMVCGRRPRRVLKLRSRKTDAVRKLTSRKPFHPDTV